MSVDVCIVRSGVAGALIAYQLGLKKKSVVVLETGPRLRLPDPERYELLRRYRDPWQWTLPQRDLHEDATAPSIALNSNRIKAVGGTTLHWRAYARRLQPPDFSMRALFGLGADWPFTYDDVEPWYLRAEHELGVSGEAAPDGPPRRDAYPLPAHPYSYADTEFVLPAFQKVGLSVGHNCVAIASQPYDGRSQCVGFATCSMCPSGAKYTALVHVRKAEASGTVVFKSDCHVRRIRLSSPRKVGYVEYVNREGRLEQQSARTFVLAAGAIEVPRLLLLSANEDHPDRLGNRSGLVGRNFMVHPTAITLGTLAKRVGGERIGYATSMSWALYKHERLPEVGNAIIDFGTAESPTPGFVAVSSGLWGEALKQHVQKSYGFEMNSAFYVEMLPAPQNGVSLSSRLRDNYGDPAPVVKMELGAFEHRALTHGVKVCQELFHAMKATEISTSSGVVGNHQCGTVRMGKLSFDSVCDEWGRCHELDNLFVAGSSLFPTSGCSNPTLTIAALSLRSGEFIANNL